MGPTLNLVSGKNILTLHMSVLTLILLEPPHTYTENLESKPRHDLALTLNIKSTANEKVWLHIFISVFADWSNHEFL